MDLQSRKLAFIQEFLRIQNEELIATLEKLLHQRKAEAYERDLQPMSEDQFNEDIDRSMDDIKNGRVTHARDLKAQVKKWQ